MAALAAGSFVGLRLSIPSTPDTPVQRVIGRRIVVKGNTVLSLTLREKTRDIVLNLSPEEVPAWLEHQLPAAFRSAVLESTEGTLQFMVNSRGRARVIRHRGAVTCPPSPAHDRQKATWLDASARPWLFALGLTDPAGKVRPSAAGKMRQLERYLEILAPMIRDCGWAADRHLTVADMGCGKGYLTFGVWHLLNRALNLNAEVVGIEARADLVEKANQTARESGANSLRFVNGDIASVPFKGLNGLVALHACNTGTDDAIARGVQLGADLIVVSPCCHQEVRPQMGKPLPLAPVLAHGILAERLGEWLTDGIRALRLQQAGYATKVIEFVPSEHTPRNLLLCGVRKSGARHGRDIGLQVDELKQFFQLSELASDRIAPANGD